MPRTAGTIELMKVCRTYLLTACILLSGCATKPDVDISKLLSDLNDGRSIDGSNYSGPDAPEAPSAGLPPLPAVRAVVPGAAGGTGTVSGATVTQTGMATTAPASSEVAVPAGSGATEVRGEEITIQPDCLIQVTVKEDRQLEGSYTVNDIGAVELGYVGPVILYNMTERQAERKVREVLESRYFRTATVRLKILKASYDKMMVLGAVNKPGVIKIGAGDSVSLNDALLRAGGLRPAIKGARVRVVKGGLTKAVALDGEEFALVSEDGRPSIPDVKLRNNDVVYVYSGDTGATAEVGEKEVLVLGEVQKPGIYRFSTAEPCTMMHLMFKLGGLPLYANAKAVKIMRRDKNGSEQEIKVNTEKILKEGKPEEDVALESGDRIIVPARRISLF